MTGLTTLDDDETDAALVPTAMEATARVGARRATIVGVGRGAGGGASDEDKENKSCPRCMFSLFSAGRCERSAPVLAACLYFGRPAWSPRIELPPERGGERGAQLAAGTCGGASDHSERTANPRSSKALHVGVEALKLRERKENYGEKSVTLATGPRQAVPYWRDQGGSPTPGCLPHSRSPPARWRSRSTRRSPTRR